MPVPSVLLVLAACHESAPEETETGGGVLVADQDALVFDRLDIGADPPATRELWIANSGPGALTVAAPRIDGDDAFTVVGDSVVLQPYEAYAYAITFDPQSPFVHDAGLIIDSYAAESVTEIALQGEALAPVFEVDESTLDLGSVAVRCSTLGSVVLRNTGNETLQVAPSLVGSSELALESGPVEILAGEQTSVDVSYEPVDGSMDKATLAFESSDPLRPHAEIAVAATGIAPGGTSTSSKASLLRPTSCSWSTTRAPCPKSRPGS